MIRSGSICSSNFLPSWQAVTRPARQTDGPALPFFEAYFSNLIEGTEFAVMRRPDIVFKGHIPTARPEDAHDVLGTWKVVSDQREMSRCPKSAAERGRRRPIGALGLPLRSAGAASAIFS